MKKILVFIGIPIALAFCITAFITLNSVNHSVSKLTTNELSARSHSTANEIEILFTKYLEIANQMAANSQIEDLLLRTAPGMVITSVEGFPQVKKTLDNVKATNDDEIMVSWIADVDSSQFTQSDGYVSGADYQITERSWYKDLVEKKSVFITEPYEDTVTKSIIVSVVAPVFKKGTQEIIGAACIDVSIDPIRAMLKEQTIGKTGFFILTTGSGQIYYHPNEELINQNVADADLSENIEDAFLKKTKGDITYTMGKEKIHGYVSPVGNTGWVVASGLPDKEFGGTYDAVRITILGIFGLALIIIIVVLYMVSRRIVNPLKKVVYMIEEMGKGHYKERLSVDSHDEIGHMAEIMNAFADKLQSDLIGTLNKISQGDVSANLKAVDDKDEITPALIKTTETLRSLNSEIKSLIHAITEGKLDTRGKADLYSGTWKELLTGINGLADAFTAPINITAEYVNRISKGDIPPRITEEYKGDFNEIKISLNTCMDAIGELVADTKMLSEAAINGDFLKRADLEKHQGDFKKAIQGINDTLDVVADKAVWYMAIIDAIPFPIHVTDANMKWTYLNKAFEKLMIQQGVIKNRESAYGMDCCNAGANICNTKGCGIRQLVDEGKTESFFEWCGKSNKQDTAYLKDRRGEKIGFVEVVTDLTPIIRVGNYTRNEVHRLEKNLKLLSSGNLDFDLNIEAADEYTTEVGEQFKAIGQSIAEVKKAVGSLIDDAAMMTTAAVEGNLKNRADVGRHGGEFARIMEGFNKTLDAVIAPVEEASAVLKEIAKGNLHVTMDGNYKGDHAEIKDALNDTVKNILSYVSEISNVLSEIGNGNLNIAITADYKGDFVEIKNSLNNIVESLNQVMGELNEAAQQVSSGSVQVSLGSQTLSQGSTEQASAIQQLTASIAEIATQTKQNAMNANEANELATDARENAEKGNEQMKGMLNSMIEINESSTNISRIIKVIDDIAFQTNILALNAAVEAARAGQHGKGFAVVAEEVRNLAARSADAAKETTVLIEGSINKVQTGTRIANDTAAALNDIVIGIEKAANLVGNIATASNEQATGIAQVNKGIEQVSQVVQNNSATAEESAAASEQLSGQAEILKGMVGRFKLRKNNHSHMLPQPNSGAHQIMLGTDEFSKY
ncbi:methyl-accepting chemotaxis protein [Sinanaerobacter chloroacetimidivorans]|nr:methyl-accepting chemotaxis protein [Sinanaerobacter chloroacetimidivorans]